MELFEELSVDSGIVLIADLEFLERFGFSFKNNRGLGLIISNSHPYFYETETTEGSVRCSGKLVFIGDPCYHFTQENWNKVLNYTKFFKDHSEYYDVLNIENDGFIELTISDLPL